MSNPSNPTNAYTVMSVSIATARTGATSKASALDKLHNLNRTRRENIFYRLFGAAQLDLTIANRFSHPVKPRECFLVPLQVIDEAVQRIWEGSISDVVYDPQTAPLTA